MVHSMLSNMTLVVLILLLLILIFVVYYVWNDSKKNRNQIMILESDVASLRDTVGELHKKVEDVFGHGVEIPRREMGGSRMGETSDILQSFMNQLNLGDLMNQGYFEDEDEEDSSEEEDSDEESGSGEEDSGEEESGEEESGEEESGEEESVEEVSGEEVETGEEVVVEEAPSQEEPKVEELIPDLSHIELNFAGKKPSADPASLDEGYIQAGGDGKQYVVALNKRGTKYWKVYKA